MMDLAGLALALFSLVALIAIGEFVTWIIEVIKAKWRYR